VWNLITKAGADKVLDATFKTGLTTPAWYVGLINGTPSYSTNDTMGSHSGWTEDTNYSESVRQTWTPGSVSNQSVDNSASKAVFSINATTTIKGAFLVDNSTKGGSTGTLYSEASFATAQSMSNGQTLSVTVTLSATPG
jgi:hypothetical protein